MWCELGGTKKDGVRFAKITARWVIFLLKVWEQHQWSSIRGRFGGSDIFCVCPLRSSLQWRASSGEALDVRTQVFTPILSTVHLLQKLLLRSGSLENISLTGSGGSTECLQSTCCLPSGCQNSFFQDIVRVVKWPTIILPTILSIPTPKHHRELLKNEFKCRENEIVLETKVTDPMYSCQRSQVEKLVELPFFLVQVNLLDPTDPFKIHWPLWSQPCQKVHRLCVPSVQGLRWLLNFGCIETRLGPWLWVPLHTMCHSVSFTDQNSIFLALLGGWWLTSVMKRAVCCVCPVRWQGPESWDVRSVLIPQSALICPCESDVMMF